MSVLFCDSNCELWFDEVERLGLKFISMPYTLEDTEYFYDLGKNTDFDFWYKSVRNGAKCITSALNPEMYDEIFRPYFEKGEDIFYITFSHALSGTFQSLDAAVKSSKRSFPTENLPFSTPRKFLSARDFKSNTPPSCGARAQATGSCLSFSTSLPIGLPLILPATT